MFNNGQALLYSENTLIKSGLNKEELKFMMSLILGIKENYEGLTNDEIFQKEMYKLNVIQSAQDKIYSYSMKQHKKEMKKRKRDEKLKNFFDSMKSDFTFKKEKFDSKPKNMEERMELLYAIHDEIYKM